jgi:hypothetical protein
MKYVVLEIHVKSEFSLTSEDAHPRRHLVEREILKLTVGELCAEIAAGGFLSGLEFILPSNILKIRVLEVRDVEQPTDHS